MIEQWLTSGFMGRGDWHDAIVKEILDNLGILFEDAKEGTVYPCLITTISDDWLLQKAKAFVKDEGDVLPAADIVDVEFVLSHLAGIEDGRYLEDRLNEVPVNEMAGKLLEEVKKRFAAKNRPLVTKARWPDFAPACAVFTHDIDTMNNPPPGGKTGQFASYVLARKVKKEAYNDNLQNIIDIENAAGIRSSFYFFPHYGKHHRHFLDNFCNTPGCLSGEVGLHGSEHSFQDPKMLASEKKLLEECVGMPLTGIRQHGLNFRNPHTWRYQEEAGFDHDLSFYYNDKFGFRAGICHPYHPFDSLTRRRFDILEIPTSFMDWTALHRGMSSRSIVETVKKLGEVVEKHHGVLVLNFHNMYINDKTHPDIARAFRNSLDHVRKKGYWIATASECARWWRMRESTKTKVTKEGDMFNLCSDHDIPLVLEYPDGRIIKRMVGRNRVEMEC